MLEQGSTQPTLVFPKCEKKSKEKKNVIVLETLIQFVDFRLRIEKTEKTNEQVLKQFHSLARDYIYFKNIMTVI